MQNNPSLLAMKTTHEYNADNTLRYTQDHLDSTFDRAFDWDHVGRLKAAYTAMEAREFAGKPIGFGGGAYRKTYQYDAWDNPTNRVATYWSQTDTLSINFGATTGRNPAWNYDAAGRVTQDENLKYFYDASGKNWKVQRAIETTPPTPPTIQQHDGDGKVIKYGTYNDHHYLFSTILGGPALTTMYTGTDGSIHKSSENIFLGGIHIGVLNDGTSYSNPPDKWMVWDHKNPVTGSDGRSGSDGSYTKEAELDPAGVNVGFEDPFSPPNPPPDPDIEPWFPKLLDDPTSPGRKCDLNGITVNCEFAEAFAKNGAAVRAPDNTVITVIRNGHPTLAPWEAFADGYAGYVPIGEKYLGGGVLKSSASGRPGDTNLAALNGATGVEAELGRIESFGFGFQAQKPKPQPAPTPAPTQPNPCAGVNYFNLDYFTPVPRGNGVPMESGIDHITNRHILLDNSKTDVLTDRKAPPPQIKSKYLFPDGISLKEAQDVVIAINRILFEQAQASHQYYIDRQTGNFVMYHYFLPVVDKNKRVIYAVIGYERKTNLPIDSATLIVDKNCTRVVTSYPGR